MDNSVQPPQDRGHVCIKKTDWLHFEQKFMAAVQELKLKRVLLLEARQEAQQAAMQVHEKEDLLDRERREAHELRVNLSVATQTVHKWEEQRKALADAATKSKALLDVAVAERDCLKDKAHKLQLEVVEARGRAEHLETQLRCLKEVTSTRSQEQGQLQAAVDQLNREVEKLKEDHGKVSKKFDRTVEVAGRVKVVAKQLSSLDAHHCRQVEDLQQKLVASNELDTLKIEKLHNVPVTEGPLRKDHVKEWEDNLAAMRSRLESQAETILQLNTTVGLGIEAQRDLQAMEAQLRTELACANDEARAYKLSRDEALTSLEKTRELLRVTEQNLLEERKPKNRPEHHDTSTQTSPVLQHMNEGGREASTATGQISSVLQEVSPPIVEINTIKLEEANEALAHTECEDICCQLTQEN